MDRDIEELPIVDSPPDEWYEEHLELTPEEIEEGNRLGDLERRSNSTS